VGPRGRCCGTTRPLLWDHEAAAVGPRGRCCGTTRGARTKAVVPRWSLVLGVKAALWDHGGPPLYPGRGPTRGARTTTTWDHPWSQPPHTTTPRAATGHTVRARRSGSRARVVQGRARTAARDASPAHDRPLGSPAPAILRGGGAARRHPGPRLGQARAGRGAWHGRRSRIGSTSTPARCSPCGWTPPARS